MTASLRGMPSSSYSLLPLEAHAGGASVVPSDMPHSTAAPIHAGRLASASICSFSMKIVSVRSQLCVRMVLSTTEELPTRLKSGCVFVSSGTLSQQAFWMSKKRMNVSSPFC